MGILDKLSELQGRRNEIESASNGSVQADSSKSTARKRLEMLFDAGSFVELNAFVSVDTAAEGVVTGYGTVEGRLVYAYSQDYMSMGGAVGAAHAKKICNILDMALKMGAPVVGIMDSTGARIGEGIDAVAGLGDILSRVSALSGVVPQLCVVAGPCAGGEAFVPAMSDFAFMVDKVSAMFVSGPAVTMGATGEATDAEKLGGATVSGENGNASFTYANESECFAGVRALIDLLPSNNMEMAPAVVPNDDINRLSQNIASIVTDGYDIVNVIKEITDDGAFIESSEAYAKNIVTGFARMNGTTVGIVANREVEGVNELDIDGCKKAAAFIGFCDSFNIPVVSFVDVNGFKAGTAQENGGLAVASAKLLNAYAEATVPKVSVIVRNAVGSAYLAMGSKTAGADLVLSYPGAVIAPMAPEGAANILYTDEIAASANPIEERAAKIEAYKKQVATPYAAAAKGFVDDIIEPDSTRPRIISALDMLTSKRENRAPRKHGTVR